MANIVNHVPVLVQINTIANGMWLEADGYPGSVFKMVNNAAGGSTVLVKQYSATINGVDINIPNNACARELPTPSESSLPVITFP